MNTIAQDSKTSTPRNPEEFAEKGVKIEKVVTQSEEADGSRLSVSFLVSGDTINDVLRAASTTALAHEATRIATGKGLSRPGVQSRSLATQCDAEGRYPSDPAYNEEENRKYCMVSVMMLGDV